MGMAPYQPSQAELDRRRTVGINAETVTDITSTDFPGHYPGEDHAWDALKFREAFKVEFHHNEPTESSFSLIGIDASVANAFRRIMIAERKAVVLDTMKDTVSRECLRHEEFEGKVKLGRIRDHFIFSIESLGQWDSDELFLESIKVLRLKCDNMKRHLANMAR